MSGTVAALRHRLEDAEEPLRLLLAELAGLPAAAAADREEMERCRLVAERIERKALAVGSRLHLVAEKARPA